MTPTRTPARIALALLVLCVARGCGGGDGPDGADASVAADAAVDAAPVFFPVQKVGSMTSVDPPRLALDSTGAGFAVWTQFDGVSGSVWAARYQPATGWGTQELLEGIEEHADSPQIAVDDQGNAAAIWAQTDLVLHFNIWGARWTAAGGWQAPTLVESNELSGAGDVRIAMTPRGDAVATWAQGDGVAYSIWAVTAAPGGPWSTPVLLESDPGTAAAPEIAIDADGRAVVVWQQTVAGHIDVRAATWDARAWTAPITIDASDDDATAPRVALGAAGDTAITWQAGGAIWLRRGAAGSLPPPVRVDTRTGGTALAPRIALDGSVVWTAFEWTDAGSRGATLRRLGDPVIELGTGSRQPAVTSARGRVLAAWKSAGLTAQWGEQQQMLSSDPGASLPAVAISGDVALVIWSEPTGIFAAPVR
ncbi:MAG: hypothetical protein IT370_35730 [Deltaproteobacteria bacterium]|nr:hypothetical protein [Deltaproteobacteria bacterium]